MRSKNATLSRGDSPRFLVKLDMSWKQPTSQKANSLFDTTHLGRFELKSQFTKNKLLTRLLDTPQVLPIVAPYQHVVHITDITSYLYRFLHVPIEPAQIEIGKVLRHQTTDRQSHLPRSPERSYYSVKQGQKRDLFKPLGQ